MYVKILLEGFLCNVRIAPDALRFLPEARPTNRSPMYWIYPRPRQSVAAPKAREQEFFVLSEMRCLCREHQIYLRIFREFLIRYFWSNGKAILWLLNFRFCSVWDSKVRLRRIVFPWNGRIRRKPHVRLEQVFLPHCWTCRWILRYFWQNLSQDIFQYLKNLFSWCLLSFQNKRFLRESGIGNCSYTPPPVSCLSKFSSFSR